MRKRYNNGEFIELEVEGRYAMFADPVSRPGGEKESYCIPTYSALVGLLEAIYWKPTFRFVIDKVRVMNEIRTAVKGERLINLNDFAKSDIANYKFLWMPRYQIQAHIEWNEDRPDLAADRNYNKHMDIFKRNLERGGRFSPYLGTSDCPAYVKPCVFGDGEGVFDSVGSVPLGVMFHSYIYPTGIPAEGENARIRKNFWKPVMENGVVSFPRPDECLIYDFAIYGAPAKDKKAGRPAKEKERTA